MDIRKLFEKIREKIPKSERVNMQKPAKEELPCEIDLKQISAISVAIENSFSHHSTSAGKIMKQMHSNDDKHSQKFSEQTNRKAAKRTRLEMQQSAREDFPCENDSKKVSMALDRTKKLFSDTSSLSEKIVKQIHSTDTKGTQEFFEPNWDKATKRARVETQQPTSEIFLCGDSNQVSMISEGTGYLHPLTPEEKISEQVYLNNHKGTEKFPGHDQ